MSSSLPVPSKAALTALRGLVVGTSCTLALVAEDRRRKINNAVRVIENGEKIRSAKGYRPGHGALAVAMEEDLLWDPGFVGSIPRTGLALHQHNNTAPTFTLAGESRNHGEEELDGRDGVENLAEASEMGLTKGKGVSASKPQSDANNNNTNSTSSSARHGQLVQKGARTSIQPLSKLATPHKPGPSWMWTNMDVVKSYSFPTTDGIMAKVREACETKNSRQLSDALRTILEAMDHRVAPGNLDPSWIEATALLCRTCQEQGLLDGAAKLLYRVVCWGTLEESAYLSHEPFALIESLLARTELSGQSRDARAADLDSAVNIFLPKFTDRPSGPNPQVCNLGRRLLELCFSAHRLQRTFGIYRRCNLVAGENPDDLAVWFLTKLYENQDYTSVVKIFISTFAESSPTEASVHAIGDLVVDSVELAHNHRPEEVLKTLHSICSSLGNTKLSPKWVIRLFSSHWKKHGNFLEIEALFGLLQTPRLKDTVFRSDNIYRIMVELALEAGDEAKADSYRALAVKHNRALASDVRLLGVVARFHAADGDWGAVRDDFETMNQRGTPSDKAYGQVFTPVLKAYAETHTVRETEAFLKSYVDELKVPLCSYTVTLMAKQYAAIRDVSSLISWLEYCSQANFPVDAAFTNAILVRCRRQWNFPFRELRTLFRKLRTLNPGFVDKHTEQVMTDAALSDSKYGGKAAHGRLLSLRVDASKLPGMGKHAQVEDVILAMKEALRCGTPRRAVWMYKRARHLNMPFSQHALRLAVQAQLSWVANDYEGAYGLLRDAQSKGEDINPIVNYLLAKQLGQITSSITSPAQADDTIQETFARYRKAGIRLTETSLHRAALTCLTAGYFQGAISYALQAAEVRRRDLPSGGGACFNLPNFKILLAAYAELVHVDGLRDTIRRGLASHYREDGACRRALRHARARVAHSRARPATLEAERLRARAVVDEGIEGIVAARRKLRAEGKQLEGAAIRIMRRAALDAGGEEVDFEGVAWLGGGGKATPAATTATTAAAAVTESGGGNGRAGHAEGGDELLDGYYSELERVLLAGAAATAVEAF
ncbi:hypothetical protein C8A00DRAFT_16181 [Chaetomidium leptoderma]|uniref:Uncharacterized protein n=1 Tax=Chaetomidium leptoderma TaxID=669021 RepID=A0AAN6ZXJ3_9PEZI|nr:hypothetical protein C8A00DRAFT_16181 [Chaetomidium leptoderma]